MPLARGADRHVPSSQRAVKQDGESGQPRIVNCAALPELVPGTVLVKTAAVALNPSDHKILTNYPLAEAYIGADFAGTVVLTHPADGNDAIELGSTIVCGAVPGFSATLRQSNGAFAEYVRAPRSLLLRAPSAWAPADAATLGTALTTCALALWGSDALALAATPQSPHPPDKAKVPVLVYGGSTATGTIALQLLRLAGYTPLAACSPRNFDLVRSRGAAAVFDYAAPDVAGQIKQHTGGRLEFVLDCVADTQSVACCYAAIQRPGGRYAHLERVPDELLRKRRAVQAAFVLAPEAYGEGVSLGEGYERPASVEKHDLAVRCTIMFQRLLDRGELMPHPVQILKGGLAAIPGGLDLLKSGTVSGKKLVAVIG